MEERKLKEAEHYNSKTLTINDGSGFSLKSHSFLKGVAVERIRGKRVLDYGCGNGIHSGWLAESAREVVGIDISDESLIVARKNRKADNIEFLEMDCERMDFGDCSFDIVFDSGSFCSLDHEKAFFEIGRILKPDGFFVGIETLGHNPIANFKRRFNKIRGKSTEWSLGHIFRMEDFETAGKYFGKIESHYFHIFSCLIIPLLYFPGGKTIMKISEKIDSAILFLSPSLKKYSFKVVFIMSNPKKI